MRMRQGSGKTTLPGPVFEQLSVACRLLPQRFGHSGTEVEGVLFVGMAALITLQKDLAAPAVRPAEEHPAPRSRECLLESHKARHQQEKIQKVISDSSNPERRLGEKREG